MVEPSQSGRLSITQLTVVNVNAVLSLLHLVQVLMQAVHQKGEELLRVLLVVTAHLRHKLVNHTLSIEWGGKIMQYAHNQYVHTHLYTCNYLPLMRFVYIFINLNQFCNLIILRHFIR